MHKDKETFTLKAPLSEKVISDILSASESDNFKLKVNKDPEGSSFLLMLLNFLPYALIIGVTLFFLNKQVGGANKSFELPEFSSLSVAKNFINILDEKEVMTDILNSGFAKDINVYIGDENEKEELKDFSVITFKHKVGDKDMGTIGIIGPKRMDYSKVISVMKYINKKLKDKGI